MDDDWDLHAVVRGCGSSASIAGPADTLLPPSSTAPGVDTSSPVSTPWLPNPFEPRELNDLQTQFLSPPKIAVSDRNTPPPPFLQQLAKQFPDPQQVQRKQLPSRSSHGSTRKSRKRKSVVKNVCLVDAENLSSDVWCWRKYGQKPIKGSPFPRGYYRCSSSKLCMARKQVERDKSNPEMFVVTYTGEHNHPAPAHRNSLAGTTRPRPTSEEEEEEEKAAEMFAPTEAAWDDDFFVGIEAFTCDEGDVRSPANFHGGGG
ncbi:hypothetical protein M569_06699 [Genlisea aurea]|uniref:WRKY domain-containing protein n=1 Tax=Genlisea aurea TaxID=192259 RepID=S8CMY1_9LAMI|nr:hypothetical protein M569_06699 [Genlisea aurea]